MAWLADVRYSIEQQEDAVLLRRLHSGALQALAVRGRPGFAGERAAPGLLYRVEWLDVCSPQHARRLGAARLPPAGLPRAAGNCLHVRCGDGGDGQTWCYRPREHDGGTLSLLPQAEPRPRRRLAGHALATWRGR